MINAIISPSIEESTNDLPHTNAFHEVPGLADGYEWWLDNHCPKLADDDIEAMYQQWLEEERGLADFRARDDERRLAEMFGSFAGMAMPEVA
jgi:hypothetical protein